MLEALQSLCPAISPFGNGDDRISPVGCLKDKLTANMWNTLSWRQHKLCKACIVTSSLQRANCRWLSAVLRKRWGDCIRHWRWAGRQVGEPHRVCSVFRPASTKDNQQYTWMSLRPLWRGPEAAHLPGGEKYPNSGLGFETWSKWEPMSWKHCSRKGILRYI